MSYESYWKCICGAFSHLSLDKCTRCGFLRDSRQVVLKDGNCESERALHDAIESYCREHQWPYIHSRMDIPTTTQRGIADFLVLMPNGKLLIAEAKTRHGKQTPEQLGWQIMVERVGHTYHIVRSIEQFKDIVNRL